MTQYVAIPVGYLAWRERYAKEEEGKWITLNGGSGDEGHGGTPVKIDGQGNIVAGPKGLKDKGIEHVDHFGDKDKQKENAAKSKAADGARGKDEKAISEMTEKEVRDELKITQSKISFIARTMPVGEVTPKDKEWEPLHQRQRELNKKLAEHTRAADDAKIAAEQKSRDAYNDREEARKKALPIKNMKNGWEVATDGARWYLRDPHTKEIIYDGNRKRVNEVAMESPPDIPSDLAAKHGKGEAKPAAEAKPDKPANTQSGLFGQVAQPTKGLGDKSQNTGTGKQSALFGKKGLSGQNNLFEDAGTEGKKVGSVETGKEFKYSGRPISTEHYAEYERWKQKYKEDKEDGKWITLKANESATGGAKVKVDDDGNILAGPSALGNKGIHNLKDFGDDEAQDRNRQKLEEGHRKIKRDAREGKDRLSNQDRLDDAIDEVMGEHPHLDEKALRDEIDDVWKEASERISERENAKAYARKLSGMNARQIDQAEDRGLDHAGTGRMDEVARDLVEAYPDLQGEFGGHDGPAKVWDFIREGKQPIPPKHDESIVQQAAARLKSAVMDFQPDDGELVPFSRRGEVDKYRLGYLAWKEKYEKS